MRTNSTPILFLFTLISLFSNATNYSNNGTSQAYSLASGDTLRITNGTYNGHIHTFPQGAVIIVSASATFKPANFNTPSGKIINYGTAEFNSLNTYSHFAFENFNMLIIKNGLNLYDGSKQVWNNNATATIKVTGNFTMSNAVFTNYATLNVSSNFAMYTATSNFINIGLTSIGGDLTVNNGILENENRIYADDFNAYGGQVINEGSISPAGNMTFNSGTTYTNKCLLVTNRGFTNYGNFTNEGLLWVGRTNTSNDHFYNSGTFTNSADAMVKTVRFTNYSTINGGGGYYITGDSYSSGTVGRSGTTTDSIKVYDVTRTSTSRIFDTQWGTVHANTVYRTLAMPDTNTVNYTGCSSFYKMDIGTLLPVEWNYVDVKLVQNQPLISWSAQYEANMKFEVERSNDNRSFVTVDVQLSNASKKYAFTDKANQTGVIYYRIKAISSVDGAVKYSDTKTAKIVSGEAAALTVYPNPVRSTATITFTAAQQEQVSVHVSNAGGQTVLSKNVMAAKGTNSVALAEVTSLQPGVYVVEVSNANGNVRSERFVKH